MLQLTSFAAMLQPFQDPYSTRRTVCPAAASMGMRNTGTKGGFEDGFPLPNGKLGIVGQAVDIMHLLRLPSRNCCLSAKRAGSGDMQAAFTVPRSLANYTRRDMDRKTRREHFSSAAPQ